MFVFGWDCTAEQYCDAPSYSLAERCAEVGCCEVYTSRAFLNLGGGLSPRDVVISH